MKNLNADIESRTDIREKVFRLESFIGSTPLFPLNDFAGDRNVQLSGKLEWQQFGDSVKARPAFRIVKDAILRGDLSEGKQLLDASSGNTGIAYAHICAALGIPVTLCLPENASDERKQILKALGVNLRFTSKTGTTDEAQEIAQQMADDEPEKYYYADQYSNDSNWQAHYNTTAEEIWDQTEGEVTHFVAGLGTTGTFVGTGRRLKELNSNIKLIGIQPDMPMHGLEGWKHLETARVPPIYDDTIADEMRVVETERAHEILKIAARKAGLILSPSSAANMAVAMDVAQELNEGTVVTVFPDDGSKYGEVLNQIFK